MLEVHRPGTAVQFGPHAATILRVQLGAGDAVMYELGYFQGPEWREMWVNSFMLSAQVAKQKIGYLPQNGV